jgi:hypothetical protein
MRVCQFPEPPIELPSAEPVTALLQRPRHLTRGFVAAQNCADTRQQLPQTERLRQIVICTQVERGYAVDLVAFMSTGDYHRDVGTRTDPSQLVDSVTVPAGQFKEHQIGLSAYEMQACFV